MASRIPNLPRIPIGAILGGAGVIAGVTGGGYILYGSIYSVKPGEKALIFSRLVGVREQVYSEGTHVAIPYLEWPIIFDVRTRPRALKTTTGTRDLQIVELGLR